MTRSRRLVAVGAAPLLLVACSGSGDAQPGGISADEAGQLNKAAEMLDANSIELDVVTNDQDPS